MTARRPWQRSPVVFLLLLLMLLLVPLIATATPSAQRGSKIESAVLEQLAEKDEVTAWIIMAEEADLSPAYSMKNWEARGRFVYNRLTTASARTQAGVRGLLRARGVPHRPFWIANTIQVTADRATLEAIASRPEVAAIVADETFEIPEPTPGEEEPRINTVEWGIDRIRAPLVWSTFGIRGEGIVVANIDTGAEFNHPALVRQYRGNQGGGTFDHNYNWFDPSRVCGNPSLIPCDNNGHGTHTMGTMVGDDGDPGANQIGVAPHARWIAAKGCESNSCSLSALLASGQWVLAPTDLNGNNPRPDLRPHIVNNSWGGSGGSDFYRSIVQSWVAAGIFPAFSNGNGGPGCGSSGSPGDYPESYSAGAFNISNAIASFSSRGPSAFGGIMKPNIAAPGVGVRSSVPGGSYASFNGTSMASPHVAGTVALMWSGAPSMVGDISQTQALLDQTAIDTSDLSCGGTAENNNVWGEGRLDAFAAVEQSPRGPTGTLQGIVTDAASGSPLANATITAVGPITRDTTTGADGSYSLTLPTGSYDVTATLFGYTSQTATGVVISDGGTTVQDFALVAAPSHPVSGHVRNSEGQAIPNATVTLLGTPIPPATTDAAGFYSFASVPEGSYNVQAMAGRCNDLQTLPLVVDGAETLDFTLAQRSDSFGYFCQLRPVAYIEATNVLPLTGDDASLAVPLPFTFTFYGQSYNTAYVATNGFLNFLGPNASFSNHSIPSTASPNGAIYPFWDDLFIDSSASIRSELLGSAPNRRFVIEWRNARFFGDLSRRVDAEVVLFENGQILTQYRNLAEDGRERGSSATIGIENHSGTVALQYAFNEAALNTPADAILYRLPPSAFVEGQVLDANDNLPIPGSRVRALREGTVVRETTTDGDGFYRMQLQLGSYSLEASGGGPYFTDTIPALLDEEDEVVRVNFALRTARTSVQPAALDLIVPLNQSRTRRLILTNSGSFSDTFRIRETGGGRVGASGAISPAKDPEYDPDAPTTEGLYQTSSPPEMRPAAPGDIIRSWTPAGLSLAWGVGYDGNVWLADVPNADINHEFTPAGSPTGRNWHASWAGSWPGDMAYDAGRNLMCQVNVGGDNGIYCWDPGTGNVVDSITGSFPWTSISQRGLAYRPDDDTFYIGGWNQEILYHIKGLSYPDKGAVIGQCSPSDGDISGLAWNPAFNVIWAATNSSVDTIYQLDPESCAVLATLAHPSPGFDGAGLEMDDEGNLWMIDQDPNRVYLIDSGLPSFVDVPWLSARPTSGEIGIGESVAVEVTVDTTGLEPGVYEATLFIQTNSGREPTLRVPVRLLVPAYRQGVNAGGSNYMDGLDDLWEQDRLYSAGSWGYTARSSHSGSTRREIDGTTEDPLYQSLRQSPVEYRFDGLPAGMYQVELRFAEIQNTAPGRRLFDVIIEDTMVLPAHDIAGEVGTFRADDHEFFVGITDGQLNIRLVPRRGFGNPIVNAIRITHRPDR